MKEPLAAQIARARSVGARQSVSYDALTPYPEGLDREIALARKAGARQILAETIVAVVLEGQFLDEDCLPEVHAHLLKLGEWGYEGLAQTMRELLK